MARYTGAVCRLCRREGQKLFLKGDRCYTDKCSIERRGYAPGQHGNARNKKLSEYGLQLREKQKAKFIYGVLEKPFRNYYKKASRMKGLAGENLMIMLESRLDNVLFRAGFGRTRMETRQIVDHKHVLVNGKCVNIPSYLVKAGDVVSIKEDAKSSQRYKDVLEVTAGRLTPEWLDVDQENLVATVKQLPTREMIDVPVDEMLIVELYNK